MINISKSASRGVIAAVAAASALPLALGITTTAHAAAVVQTKNILAEMWQPKSQGGGEACITVSVSGDQGSKLIYWQRYVNFAQSGNPHWVNAGGTANVGDEIEIEEFPYASTSTDTCEGKMIAEGELTVPADSYTNAWVQTTRQ